MEQLEEIPIFDKDYDLSILWSGFRQDVISITSHLDFGVIVRVHDTPHVDGAIPAQYLCRVLVGNADLVTSEQIHWSEKLRDGSMTKAVVSKEDQLWCVD